MLLAVSVITLSKRQASSQPASARRGATDWSIAREYPPIAELLDQISRLEEHSETQLEVVVTEQILITQVMGLDSPRSLDDLVSLNRETRDWVYQLVDGFDDVPGYLFVFDQSGKVLQYSVLPNPLFPAQGCFVLQPGDNLIATLDKEGFWWRLSPEVSP